MLQEYSPRQPTRTHGRHGSYGLYCRVLVPSMVTKFQPLPQASRVAKGKFFLHSWLGKFQLGLTASLAVPDVRADTLLAGAEALNIWSAELATFLLWGCPGQVSGLTSSCLAFCLHLLHNQADQLYLLPRPTTFLLAFGVLSRMMEGLGNVGQT